MKTEKYTVKNTAGMFNLLKGIAMLIVLKVHTNTLFPDVIFNRVNEKGLLIFDNLSIPSRIFLTLYYLIACIIMPALFIISGYGFRKTTFKKNISKQFKSLMIPYIVTMLLTSGLHLCTHFCLYRYFPGSVKETLKIFGGSLLGLPRTTTYGNITFFANGPNWFLMAMFIGMIVFNTLITYFDKIKLLVAVLIISTVGWLISLGNTIPFCLSQGLVSVFYIYLGYYAKKSKLFTEGINIKKKTAYVILVIVPFLITTGYGCLMFMSDSKYSLGMISILLSGLFALCFIYAFLLLNRFNGIISSSIRNVGQISIYVLCIHTMELLGFPYYHFAEKWNGGPMSGTILFWLIRATVVLTLCFTFLKVKDIVLLKVSKKGEINTNV